MAKFEPGQSGNPSGRPKQKPFLDWCKKWTVEKAECFLAPIAENPKRKDQLEAIKTIMAYGVGKPVDTVESSIQFEGLAGNPVEIAGGIAEIIARGATEGLGQGGGDGAAAADVPAQVPNPERSAGEGNP